MSKKELERARAIWYIKFLHDSCMVFTGMALYNVIIHFMYFGQVTPMAFDGVIYAAFALGIYQFKNRKIREFEETYEKEKK